MSFLFQRRAAMLICSMLPFLVADWTRAQDLAKQTWDLLATYPSRGVVQNDADNARMSNTIVAQVTTNLRRAGEATQLLIDRHHSDWASSGLHRPSVVNCSNIYTAERRDIARVIGRLSDATMQEIDECLKAALGIS